jgi:hypothetical protein
MYLALRHEGVLGSGCIYPRFLDLSTSCRYASIALTFVPLDLVLAVYQKYSRQYGENFDSDRARTATTLSSGP